MLGNITSALEIKFENMKQEADPIFIIDVKIQRVDENGDNETGEAEDLPMYLYSGDTIFNAVFRFCQQNALNLYRNGEALEQLILTSLENATDGNLTQLLLGENEENESNEKPVLSLSTDPSKAVNITSPNLDVNNTRFKLFTLPVKVDNRNVNLDFYNGDKLQEKVSSFCQEHGLNETIAKQPLMDAVMNYSKAIQEKFPDSLWFESL